MPNEGTYDAQKYTWDPDDTLALVQRRVEPTEQQGNDQNKLRSRYYAEVEQVYDHSGNRAIKRWNKVIDRPNGTERTSMRETLYADGRLTLTREVGEKPEALLHVFAGAMRVASKWIGGQGVFTYHAQLPTRTVSDVVYAQGDDRTTARLHQQIEYTTFGDLLAGREKVIAQGTRDPGDRPRLTRPLYRFDAKEFDEETGLTYFGARHYHQRFGIWLSPDPVLGEYLAGQRNFGVFNPKNLSAYGFGWANPISNSDKDGRSPDSILQSAKEFVPTWQQAMGTVRAVGGACEVVAGVCLGAATSWTGVGAVAGGAIAVHGADQIQAGLRQAFFDEHVDSFTSQGIQKGFGASQTRANQIDAGLSIVGSAYAGWFTASMKVAAIRASSTEAANMSAWRLLWKYDIGSQALSDARYLELGGTATSALEKAEKLSGPGVNFLKGLNLWKTGPTPLGNLGVGAGGAAGGGASLSSE